MYFISRHAGRKESFTAAQSAAPSVSGVYLLSYTTNGLCLWAFLTVGWTEAADLIVKGMGGAINAKTVTYDFERLMEGAKLLKCSEFGDAMISNM